MAATVAGQEATGTSPQKEASAGASAGAAASKTRRDAVDLLEVMRRRRDSCEEFESVPSSSTADCSTAAELAPEPTEAAVKEFESVPSTSTADCSTFAAPAPAAATLAVAQADASAGAPGGAPVAGSTTGGLAQPEAPASPTSRARVSSRTSTAELQDWMARMRARCQILESTPGDTTADAKNEFSHYDGTGAKRTYIPCQRPVAGQGPPSKPSLAALAAPSEVPKPEPPAASSAEHIALRLRLREGSQLAPSERLQVWPSLLLHHPSSAGDTARALPALTHLLGSSGGGADEEETLFDASASGDKSSSAAALCTRLATAFSEKYVTSLSGQVNPEDDQSATLAPVYAALAQLLRYHYPAAACAIDAVSVPAGFTLAEVLGVVCGGPAGLAQCLLTPRGAGEAEALLLACDLLVMEDEDKLLLLVAAVLLSEVVPEPGSSFEQVKELIRSKRGLGGLGSRGREGVCNCVAAARAMLETTPVSLTTALGGDERARARLRLPMCAVAPDEALHHIYERPPGSWRLLLVDVRMRASERALPVCMRLGQCPHNERRKMLRDLAYEESIHVCLLGDGPAIPGDDAFELCRHLVSPSVQRKHVSVVDGGWPAVEELADSLRLHLMPLEQEETPASRSSLKEARAAVAGVAGQVASATEVGQKMAQRMLKGMRGGVLSVLGADSKTGTEGKKPPIEV